jgi:hypothetical protein
MYPATTGRPPCAPLMLFKMSLLQHCYGLSDPQCEELVSDRLSWRRFVGLGLQDAVPDETTLVRFRQRLREHGLHENLLGLVNRQLQTKGLILKTCTLVDATLLQAARRAPAKGDATGGDGDAGYTVKQGRTHYGYKAHVAVDETHTLIRQVTLSAANRLKPAKTRALNRSQRTRPTQFYLCKMHRHQFRRLMSRFAEVPMCAIGLMEIGVFTEFFSTIIRAKKNLNGLKRDMR